MANYPQRKKRPEEMGSADDGAAYVKRKGRAERDWAEDAAVKTNERGEAAAEERVKDTKYYKKGGKVKKYSGGGQPDGPKEEYKSSRTTLLEKQPKNVMQEIATKISRKLDDLGITQEKQYAGKSKEEMAVKKASGGAIKSSASKRADGCAVKGKTKGRMV